jgi:ATP-dependent DNA ligase
VLDNVVLRYGLERTEPFIGEGRPLFNSVCRLHLEGFVAKRMGDGYGPKTRLFKSLNPTYFAEGGLCRTI